MNYAVIAAGEGARLAGEGISDPKPLVPIQGKPMLVRLLDRMVAENAEVISIIINPRMPEVRMILRVWQKSHPEVELRVCEQVTLSSMHSLSVMSEIIPKGKFVLTTVDTLFQPEEFHSFVQDWEQSDVGADNALFGVTSFVDDEKPLWINIAGDGCISEFADEGPRPFVSGGIYALNTETAFPVLKTCIASGQSRMRNFQRALLADGLRIRAFEFSKIMDIDHAADIWKAEDWLSEGDRTLLVYRAAEFSPNSEQKDAAILNAVGIRLAHQGIRVRAVSETDLRVEHFKAVSRVFSMGRRQKTLLLLGQQMQCNPELRVVNPPSGVQITAQSRSTTLELLDAAGVKVPRFWAYEPADDDLFQCEPELQQLLPGWVKGMHLSGVSAHDVEYVKTPLEADSGVIRLASSNYVDIVVMRHIQGILLKVYCVLRPDGTIWMRWYAPDQADMKQPEADSSCLSSMAQQIACALNLRVFGFDAILDVDGNLNVIDVNDWPSFSKFRDEAASEIAKL